MVVDRREEVAHPDATAGHVGAEAVGRADDLAARDAAAAEEERDGAGPVVAARLRHPRGRVLGVADLRRPAELAGDHDQHPAVEAAGVDVLDQGADGLVEVAAARLHGVEDVVVDGVVVPVADPAAERAVQAGRHQVHAGLDQSPGQQAALAPGVPAVAVAEPGILPAQVERPARLRAGRAGVGLLAGRRRRPPSAPGRRAPAGTRRTAPRGSRGGRCGRPPTAP